MTSLADYHRRAAVVHKPKLLAFNLLGQREQLQKYLLQLEQWDVTHEAERTREYQAAKMLNTQERSKAIIQINALEDNILPIIQQHKIHIKLKDADDIQFAATLGYGQIVNGVIFPSNLQIFDGVRNYNWVIHGRHITLMPYEIVD